jgi:hypothetical protein
MHVVVATLWSQKTKQIEHSEDYSLFGRANQCFKGMFQGWTLSQLGVSTLLRTNTDNF